MCFCVFSSHPFWISSSLDVPAGVTQEEGHTGFLIHLPSAVRALIFVARRIQPFLSLVDREVSRMQITHKSIQYNQIIIGYIIKSQMHIQSRYTQATRRSKQRLQGGRGMLPVRDTPPRPSQNWGVGGGSDIFAATSCLRNKYT